MATNISNPSTGQSGYAVPGQTLSPGWVASPSQVSKAVSAALPNQGATVGGGGAVTATGQQLNSTGQVTGQANPKDVIGNPANPVGAKGMDVNTAQPGNTPTPPTPATPATSPTPTDTTGSSNPSITPGGESDLKSKYTQALSDLGKSGVKAPVTPGSANAGVKTALDSQPQPQTYDTTKADQVLASDEAHNKYVQDYVAAQNAQSSRDSLQTTYDQLSKQLGLPAINSQLMNITAVIDGTEQNIRDEVTASGGFATESQVQALANARNKTLIQQQKELTDTRNNLQSNLTTMVGFEEKDRAYAQQQIDSQLNFDQKQIDFTDKAVNNGQDILKYMATTEGWSGVYKAALATGDPQALQRINSLMGGGFDVASMAASDQTQLKNNLDIQSKELGIENSKLNIQGSKLDIEKKQQDLNDTAGVPNPTKANQPGYSLEGVKYTPASATSHIEDDIKTQGLMGTRKLLAPGDYNLYKAWWVTNNLTSADFDNIFGGYRDQNKIKQYN